MSQQVLKTSPLGSSEPEGIFINFITQGSAEVTFIVEEIFPFRKYKFFMLERFGDQQN